MERRGQELRADDLVFPNSKGGFLDHKNILKREFRPLLARQPSTKAFNWHAIGRFAIGPWMKAGMQPKNCPHVRRSLLTGRHDEPLRPHVSKRHAPQSNGSGFVLYFRRWRTNCA
ncbi:hypothetical protein AJ87_25240 [Rhizobium yanglingense]|nr:hypothetical protein AJ87_25240 [Rhizobium yanglingense]